MGELKKKNKLDLDYNRCCQFLNTTIIVLITIFLGFLLAVLTNQIQVGKNMPFIFVISLFIAVLIISVYFLISFYSEMKAIIRKIDKLKI